VGLGISNFVATNFPYVMYFGAIVALLLSLFWRPIAGIFYLVPLIPLQTLRYEMNNLPLATSMISIMLIGIALGLLRQGVSFLPKTPWTLLICVYAVYTYLSTIMGSFYLGTALPLPGNERFGVWVDYMCMPALLLLVAAIGPSKRQTQVLVLMMCITAFLLERGYYTGVSGRDFTAYSEDLREEGGALGYAGLNGMASFAAQFCTFMLAFAAFERKSLLKLGGWALAAFSAVICGLCLSRGGYAAILAGWLFIGLAKQRILLILLLVFLLGWTGFVPGAIQDRVLMTYDSQSDTVDHSSETRIYLWYDALQLFASVNVVFGTGFNTYAYMHNYGGYQDTHNIYLKALLETGLFGLALLLWLMGKTFRVGWRFSRSTRDPFMASLGLGLAGWVLCAAIGSLFGDRWTYFQVNAYMWIIAGFVAAELRRERAGSLQAEAKAGEAEAANGEPALEPVAAT
jgi:putative inorganic carbon (HCO3(-)) transporter